MFSIINIGSHLILSFISGKWRGPCILENSQQWQSRNEKIRPLYSRTQARPKLGDSQENRWHAHQNIGHSKKMLVMPIQISWHTPINFDGHDVTARKLDSKWHTANVNKRNGVIKNLQIWQVFNRISAKLPGIMHEFHCR